MDCRNFNEYLDAFADGELEPEKNLEVAAHVDQCEACAASVARIRSLRGCLSRVFAGERATEELRLRIQDAILAESCPPVHRFAAPRRWVAPLGVAAAIAVVWLAYPLVAQWGGGVTANGSAKMRARVVRLVVGRHFGCLKLGPGHHRSGLPRDADGIARVMAAELGFEVSVPDLSRAGYRLHSADSCGVKGMPGSHAVYERVADGVFVSVFSVSRIDGLSCAHTHEPGMRRCAVCGEESGAAVVGWHQADSTVVMCGKLPRADLIALADGVR